MFVADITMRNTMLTEEEVFRRVIKPSPKKAMTPRGKLSESEHNKKKLAQGKRQDKTETKSSKYEVSSRDSLGSSDSRQRKLSASKLDCNKKLNRKTSSSAIEVTEDTTGVEFTEITDLSRIPDSPRPELSSLPPIGSRSRSLSPDTAALIRDKFKDNKGSKSPRRKKQGPMSIAAQAERTGSGKSVTKSTKSIPVKKPGATQRKTGVAIGPSPTDYDFLRRALSEEKQPFLPAPSQRRGRSNSLPCETADITSLSIHLRNLAEKSSSAEGLDAMARSPDGSGSSAKSPENKTPEKEESSPQRPPSPADLIEKTNQWVSALPDSPPTSPSMEENYCHTVPSTNTNTNVPLSSSPPSSHGVMMPRRKPDAFLENRRQSLNLVVVYGSDEETEFKPTRTRDHFEKRRTDAFPFGRVFQALKIKLSSPSLVINENDIELEGPLS